jgi:hypothetical protein
MFVLFLGISNPGSYSNSESRRKRFTNPRISGGFKGSRFVDHGPARIVVCDRLCTPPSERSTPLTKPLLSLQKLIKELPSLVPAEDGSKATSASAKGRARAASKENLTLRPGSPDSSVATESTVATALSSARQLCGDKTTEVVKQAAHAQTSANDDEVPVEVSPHLQHRKPEELGKSPGEIAFFKLLHAELKKATHFFERAQEEFSIREERVQEGMEIMKQPNSIMVNEKWSLLAKSIYRLYKDLLLLETFAIMTYCSFSKILKKHDKVTGYQTRVAFMANVVNKANFTNYPNVLGMISRCERMYEDVSRHLLHEGKEALYEDERLFINMISRLNEQVLDFADDEGALASDRKEGRRSVAATVAGVPRPAMQRKEGSAISSLRDLVEENDATAAAAHVSEGQIDDDVKESPKKRCLIETMVDSKRPKRS